MIDCTAFVAQKFRALEAHRTQLGTTQMFLQIPEEFRAALGHEHYVLARSSVAASATASRPICSRASTREGLRPRQLRLVHVQPRAGLGALGADVEVERNDAVTVDDDRRACARRGRDLTRAGWPSDAGISDRRSSVVRVVADAAARRVSRSSGDRRRVRRADRPGAGGDARQDVARAPRRRRVCSAACRRRSRRCATTRSSSSGRASRTSSS